MGGSLFSIHIMVLLLFIFLILLEAVHGTRKCYIVYLGAHSHGPRPTSLELEIATNSHYDLLSSTLGSREKAKEAIIYSYNKHINGFAALLEDAQAAYIAKKANIVSVFLSKPHKLHTTRSWEFLGLQRNGKNTAWQKGNFGENTIIANIDSGVWPESESFNEKGFGPIPSKWHGGKACQISQFRKLKKNPCNSREKAKEAIIYSYNKHINGFAALLEDAQAAYIAKNGNVVSVFLSKPHKLHTTRSWEFLGLQRNGKNTAWQQGKFGENTIIANIDSGVWPESKSFSDNGFGPIPSKWRGRNACQIRQFGKLKKNPCNRKLIGAKFFSNAYEAYNGKLHPSLLTARDFVGHGTHTLSTAGGNFVPGASIFGIGNGTVKGGSPRARVATYKVCWSLTDVADCFGADVLAAIDQAISDGVDIISLSAAGQYLVHPEDIFTDEVSIGAFHALSRNILVVASAGNDGPTLGSVVNIAPWVFTIAASTLDRDFSSTITFGNNQQVTGASLFVNLPPNQAFSLILATDGKLANATNRDAQLCRPGTLDPSKVKGKIVGCDREGNIKSVGEGQEALTAGAKGMLLSNRPQQGKTSLAEPHVLSCVTRPQTESKYHPPAAPERAGSHAPAFDITSMDSKLKSGTTIKFSGAKTFYGRKPAPVMASFSSRGPNKIQPSILKPDVTAPGVNILAAYSLFASASNLVTDNRKGFPFNVMQGTSMSCPHVAGIAGLLKTKYPNWSPAAIKSAIMTTATTLDNTNRPIQDAFEKKLATPFAYGSGHVQPDLAIDPGLVYDLGIKDYLNFLCAYGYNQQLISALNFNGTFVCSGSHSIEDFNYPSITLPNLELNAVNVTRTVTNVGSPSTYVAKAQLPGYKIVVVPNSLTFKKIGEKKTFQVIVQATNVTPRKKYQFGNLQWTDGKHIVRSPITVKRK